MTHNRQSLPHYCYSQPFQPHPRTLYSTFRQASATTVKKKASLHTKPQTVRPVNPNHPSDRKYLFYAIIIPALHNTFSSRHYALQSDSNQSDNPPTYTSVRQPWNRTLSAELITENQEQKTRQRRFTMSYRHTCPHLRSITGTDKGPEHKLTPSQPTWACAQDRHGPSFFFTFLIIM